MRLRRLKVLTAFRGLQPGFQQVFTMRGTKGKVEAHCLVGPNGSGKSNVLEVLGEIFFYLENYVRPREVGHAQEEPDQPGSRGFGFELELQQDAIQSQTILDRFEVSFVQQEERELTILIKLETTGDLVLSIPELKVNYSTAKEVASKMRQRLEAVLPVRIVGYSSGGNELISNPYRKMEMTYFDKLVDRSKEGRFQAGITGEVVSDRLFLMDYQSNKLITVCNYLFAQESDDLKKLGKLVAKVTGVERLFSFGIEVRKKRKGGLGWSGRMDEHVAKLKRCSTTIDEDEAKGIINMDFLVDDAVRSAFVDQFGSAIKLFNVLTELRALNAVLHSQKLRNRVKAAKAGTDISDILPTLGTHDLVFSVHSVTFMKKGARTVSYRHLSDGEHQIMHVLGSMVLLGASNTLFLLDEPETHFNPEWRARFISLLNECMMHGREEIVLTTHSPFVVSDCQADRVFKFHRKGKQVVCESAQELGVSTYGASVSLLTMAMFGQPNTIGGTAYRTLDGFYADLRKRKKSGTVLINEANKALGDSVEKDIFISQVIRAYELKP